MYFLWENDPASHLIRYLSKLLPNEFMLLLTSLKPSPVQYYGTTVCSLFKLVLFKINSFIYNKV